MTLWLTTTMRLHFLFLGNRLLLDYRSFCFGIQFFWNSGGKLRESHQAANSGKSLGGFNLREGTGSGNVPPGPFLQLDSWFNPMLSPGFKLPDTNTKSGTMRFSEFNVDRIMTI